MKKYNLLFLENGRWLPVWCEAVPMDSIVYTIIYYGFRVDELKLYSENFGYEIDVDKMMESVIYHGSKWIFVSAFNRRWVRKEGFYKRYLAIKPVKFRCDPIAFTGVHRRRMYRKCNVHRHLVYESMYPEFNRKKGNICSMGYFDHPIKQQAKCWKDKKIKHQWEKNLK